jgi:hypothetical protein
MALESHTFTHVLGISLPRYLVTVVAGVYVERSNLIWNVMVVPSHSRTTLSCVTSAKAIDILPWPDVQPTARLREAKSKGETEDTFRLAEKNAFVF